jgi:hypothetical protein
MELNAFSARERAKLGKENSKWQALKKAEAIIEAAADKGHTGAEIKYSDLENFEEHYKFIATDLHERDFRVSVEFYGGCSLDKIWVSWLA